MLAQSLQQMAKVVTLTRDLYGKELLQGEKFELEGPAEKMLDVKSLWSLEGLAMPPVKRFTKEPDFGLPGKVYYGKLTNDNRRVRSRLGYLVHEAWFIE